MKKTLLKISALTKKAARRFSTTAEKEFQQMMLRWKKEDAEKEFRTRYRLDKNSVVFDLGGYQGQWASDIYGRYRCAVYVFEPLPTYARKITDRFAKNEDIRVYDFGLGARDEQVQFSVAGDSTSMFIKGGQKVDVELKQIDTFLAEQKIEAIDLMKINIEGGEFDLLDHMLEVGLVPKIKDLQIQFHHFMPDAATRMKKIQKGLAETHELTYEFPFLWENWRRK